MPALPIIAGGRCHVRALFVCCLSFAPGSPAYGREQRVPCAAHNNPSGQKNWAPRSPWMPNVYDTATGNSPCRPMLDPDWRLALALCSRSTKIASP